MKMRIIVIISLFILAVVSACQKEEVAVPVKTDPPPTVTDPPTDLDTNVYYFNTNVIADFSALV